MGIDAHRDACNILYGDGHVTQYGDPRQTIIWHPFGQPSFVAYYTQDQGSLAENYFYGDAPAWRGRRRRSDAVPTSSGISGAVLRWPWFRPYCRWRVINGNVLSTDAASISARRDRAEPDE
jgi:prepilin-type processing-associated H-X9-DG protein